MMTDPFRNSSSMRIVARDRLDLAKEELELAQTELVDQSSALRIGRVLGARYFIYGTIVFSWQKKCPDRRTDHGCRNHRDYSNRKYQGQGQ